MAEHSLPLTAFQRRVIEHLREVGYAALAEMASHEWSRGKQVPVADSMAVGEPQGELRADFVKANKQVTPRIDHQD